MTDDDDTQTMLGTVQQEYPNTNPTKRTRIPSPTLVITGNTYSTFDDDRVTDIDSTKVDAEVRFPWKQDGNVRNIDDSVEIVDTGPGADSEALTRTPRPRAVPVAGRRRMPR